MTYDKDPGTIPDCSHMRGCYDSTSYKKVSRLLVFIGSFPPCSSFPSRRLWRRKLQSLPLPRKRNFHALRLPPIVFWCNDALVAAVSDGKLFKWSDARTRAYQDWRRMGWWQRHRRRWLAVSRCKITQAICSLYAICATLLAWVQVVLQWFFSAAVLVGHRPLLVFQDDLEIRIHAVSHLVWQRLEYVMLLLLLLLLLLFSLTSWGPSTACKQCRMLNVHTTVGLKLR